MYINIGVVFGFILFLTVPYLTLKNRVSSKGPLEDLYQWWDGYSYDETTLILGLMLFICINLLISILAIVVWLPIIIITPVVLYVIKVRNKRINNLKNK